MTMLRILAACSLSPTGARLRPVLAALAWNGASRRPATGVTRIWNRWGGGRPGGGEGGVQVAAAFHIYYFLPRCYYLKYFFNATAVDRRVAGHNTLVGSRLSDRKRTAGSTTSPASVLHFLE